MTESKDFYIWYEDIMQFVKVHMSIAFTMQVQSISTCGDKLLVMANNHLFQATVQHKQTKLYQLDTELHKQRRFHQTASDFQEQNLKKDLAQFTCSKFSIKRLPHLSNVLDYCCDSDGESFIAILAQIALEVKEPERAVYDFSKLLDEFEFVDSGIMDVNFVVKQRQFPANKFVVSSRCSHLRDLIIEKGATCVVNDEKLTANMFECILLWIYTNRLSDDDFKKILGADTNDQKAKKLAQDFVAICQDWKLDGICNLMSVSKVFQKHVQSPELIKVKSFKWFSMQSLPAFHDVTILLDDSQELQAHKVILVMRIEYFKMMFYHSWSESSKIDLRHVSINFMRPIVQFAYDNNPDALRKANYTENFMYNMCAILDQFLIEDVKNIFETMLMRKVNLKNCAENLEFSMMYNCSLLKDFCLEFISLNITRLLEGSILDSCDIETVKELSAYYKKYFGFDTDSSHLITPAFDAPTDEEIDKIVEGFDLSSYNEKLQQSMRKTPKGKNRLSKSELLKRNYEKEAIKNMKIEDDEPVIVEPTTPKTQEIETGNWQQKRERKDSGKRKVLVSAAKCNEVLKNESVYVEPMVDLRNLRNSVSEEPEHTRNVITLADFGFKVKNKAVVVEEALPRVEVVEIKSPWNMASVELKPQNSQQSASDPFKSIPAKKKGNSPKPPATQKNFSSIVRDERKDKSIHEKTKTKSLVLTQIEEKAIAELSEFYNIANIHDESITIHRKVQKASQNLSQWQHQSSLA